MRPSFFKGPAWRDVDMGYKTPCRLWLRSTDYKGYGQIWNGKSMVKAHKYFYEKTKGPVPQGLVLDHLCKVNDCINVDHLEPVTSGENIRRSTRGTRQIRRSVMKLRPVK